MQYDLGMLSAFAAGSIIGGLFWFGLLAVAVHFLAYRQPSPDKKAGYFLVAAFALLAWQLTQGADPVLTALKIPPVLLVWWLFRRYLRRQADRRSITLPDAD